MGIEQVNQELILVERVKKGDRQAFAELVRNHQRGLTRLAFRFVRDLATAEDVVQDTFIKAYQKIDSFAARSSFKSWLYQILVNTARNHLRDHRGEAPMQETLMVAILPQAEKALLDESLKSLVQAEINQLPLKQRTALVLRIFEDLSFKEIAEIMSCPYDTAKANYRHAILRLQKTFSNYEDLTTSTQEPYLLTACNNHFSMEVDS